MVLKSVPRKASLDHSQPKEFSFKIFKYRHYFQEWHVMLNSRLYLLLSESLERLRVTLVALLSCVGRAEECIDVVEPKNL